MFQVTRLDFAFPSRSFQLAARHSCLARCCPVAYLVVHSGTVHSCFHPCLVVDYCICRPVSAVLLSVSLCLFAFFFVLPIKKIKHFDLFFPPIRCFPSFFPSAPVLLAQSIPSLFL